MKKNRIKIMIAFLLGISSLGYINSQTANSSSNISPPGNLLSSPADMPAALQNNITSPTQNNTSAEYIQENYDLHRFLEEAPPIRKIVYGIDATTYFDKNDTEETTKEKKGKHVFHEGSWQPNTFYERPLEDLPGTKFAFSPKGFVAGCNANGLYWTVEYSQPQGIITTAEKNRSSEKSSYAESRAKMGSGRLNRARNLWINCLIPGTLKWIDEDHFQAEAEPSFAGTSDEERILTGTVTRRDEQGRPTKIEYQWPAILDKGEIWNEYIYSEPVGKTKLPNIMVQATKYNMPLLLSKTFYVTNVLTYIEIGTTNLSELGYTPAMFVKKDKTVPDPPLIFYQSNDVTYEVIDGVMQVKAEVFVPNFFQRHRGWSMVLLILILLFPLFWKYKNNFKKNGIKNHEQNNIKLIIALFLGILSLEYTTPAIIATPQNTAPPPLSTNDPASTHLPLSPADIPITPQTNISHSSPNITSSEYIQENYDLRRFLEEAPPLRKVVYGIDATTYYSSKDTEEIRKAKKGKHVFYEGSWQPNTFYDKILDDLPGREFAIEHKGFVVGRNANGLYWVVEYLKSHGNSPQQGVISTAEKNQPGEKKSYPESYAGIGEGRLHDVRNLWINCLIPGTLKWIDEDHFQAEAIPPTPVTSDEEKILTGTVTRRDDQGRPTKIEYQWPAILDEGKIWNEYIYSEPVGKTKLPNIMVQATKYNMSLLLSKTFYVTNVLTYIEIGTTNLSELGYTPAMFLKKDVTTPPLIFHRSNDVTYEVIDGAMELKPNRKFVNGTEVMP